MYCKRRWVKGRLCQYSRKQQSYLNKEEGMTENERLDCSGKHERPGHNNHSVFLKRTNLFLISLLIRAAVHLTGQVCYLLSWFPFQNTSDGQEPEGRKHLTAKANAGSWHGTRPFNSTRAHSGVYAFKKKQIVIHSASISVYKFRISINWNVAANT